MTCAAARLPTVESAGGFMQIKDSAGNPPDNSPSPIIRTEILMHACDQPTVEAIYPFDARGVAKRFPPRGNLRRARRAAPWGDDALL
jgi:hypothetical protein